MNNNENLKWEEMLSAIMVKGKKIKRRNTIIKAAGGLTFGILVAVSVLATTYKYEDFNREDLLAEDLNGNEIEVALVAADTFFDEDLEMLIY